MTTDYEKRYNEALERARKALSEIPLESYGARKIITDAFPELAESEDERIRKAIINIIKQTDLIDWNVSEEQMLAWLEKQKENIEKEYVFRPLAGTDITIAAEQAIRRANEGDRLVLAFNGAYIPVRKGCNANKIVEIYDAFIEKQKEQKPVNNEKVEMTEFEQSVYDLCPVLGIEEAKATASDLLELAKQALLKTGKVVLASNYPEGCSFEDGFHLGYTEGFNAKQEQKPAEWKPTEEQFNYLAKAIMTLGEEGDCKTAGVLSEIRKGLKCSFPDWKVSPDYPEEGCNVSLNGEVKKIQEWSEEDEKRLKSVIHRIEVQFAGNLYGEGKLDVDWLKSLRPSWKPSEELIGCLERLIAFKNPEPEDIKGCEELLDQLKKLM